MFEYLKQVIFDPVSKSPSTHRYIAVLASWTLSIGFMASVISLFTEKAAPEGIVIGLAGILATLAGSNYYVAKNKDSTKTEE